NRTTSSHYVAHHAVDISAADGGKPVEYHLPDTIKIDTFQISGPNNGNEVHPDAAVDISRKPQLALIFLVGISTVVIIFDLDDQLSGPSGPIRIGLPLNGRRTKQHPAHKRGRKRVFHRQKQIRKADERVG